MFAEHGITVRPEDFVPFIGTGERRYLGGVAEKYGLAIDLAGTKERTYDIYLELIRGELKALPGVYSFLERCKTLGKKIAVASSADRRKVEGNLRELGLGFGYFDAVVTGEDAERKKPAPDLFLTAAARLGLAPETCLVIEDAVSGVQAAKAAGMRCLALTTSFPKEALQAADYLAGNLAEVPEEVLHWKD
jgi:HAD superfamily hydrolase (TIGR01509 family)